ncbi:MAG: hypothetical protein IT318_04810, partial [Anaerolineales bacterium]|nr:hypothetical protein [Anaerolineales bacterium]
MSRRLSLSLRLGALHLALGLTALAARVAFGAAATAAPGAQSGGVQFLDDAPITVTWPVDSASLTLTVGLINTSANPRQAWLTLAGLADVAGQPPPAGLLPAMPVALELDAHKALAVPLALQRAADLAGQYTGRLVVYDDAGGLSRRPLTLVVAAAGPLPDLTAQPVLDTAFLPQLSLATVNAWPSPLAGLGLSAVTPARVAVAPEASPPRLVGLVADSQGRLGRVWHEGSELLVSDLTRAGAYAGQVDLSPAAAGGESALTVQVRDLALWAAIALGLGLVASTWLERTATYDLPRRRLEVRLRRRLEEAQASQNAARGTLPPAWPFGQQVFEAYTADPDSLLNKAAREVLARFDAAQTAEERSRWGPNGDEAKKL